MKWYPINNPRKFLLGIIFFTFRVSLDRTWIATRFFDDGMCDQAVPKLLSCLEVLRMGLFRNPWALLDRICAN